jgi:hypothetical protein
MPVLSLPALQATHISKTPGNAVFLLGEITPLFSLLLSKMTMHLGQLMLMKASKTCFPDSQHNVNEYYYTLPFQTTVMLLDQ